MSDALLINGRIHELRLEAHMNQEQIASLLCVSQRTYSDYETGAVRIGVDSCLTLARFYDVSMDYLGGTTDIRKPFPRN